MAAKDEEETDIESAFEVTDTHDANISDIPIIPGREQLAQSEDDGEIKKEEVCGHQIERLTEMAGHVVANKEADRKEKTDFQSFLKEGKRQKLLMKTDFEGMQDVARITEKESAFEITDFHDVKISYNLPKPYIWQLFQSEDDGEIEEERQTEMTGNVASVTEEGRKEKDFSQRFLKEGDGRKPLMKSGATYKEKKNELKRYLITEYISKFQPDTLPGVDRLYVEPSMKLATDGFLLTDDEDIFREDTDTDTENTDTDRGIKISDVFFKDQKKFYRICISGNAGQGKTALCKMLSLAWCQVHSSETISEHIPDDFINVMKNFDILFYIGLPDFRINCLGLECIRSLYFKDECFFNLFVKNECDNSSILVILDGMDDGLIFYDEMMYLFRGFTTLTTMAQNQYNMRMWPQTIDRKIILTGLSEEASDRYITNMIDILNQKKKYTKDNVVFKQQVNDNNLKYFLNIPIILKQLITLWHHDENEIIGRSRVHLYSAMINRLLMDEEEGNKNKSVPGGTSEEKYLPLCLEEKQHCKNNKDLLLSLSHLAFISVFEERLSFSPLEASVEHLTTYEIEKCENILCWDNMATLSFQHKSFRDFLAAVFLVMNHKSEQLPKLWTTSNILDMRSPFLFACGMDTSILTLLLQLLETRQKNRKYESQLLEPIQDLICECIKACENKTPSQPSFHLESVVIVSELKNTDWRWGYLMQLINKHPSSIKTLHVYNDEENPSVAFSKCLKRVLSKCRSIGHVRLVLWKKLSHDIEAELGEAFRGFWSSSSLTVYGEVPNALIPYIDDETNDQDETMLDQLQRNGKLFPERTTLTDFLHKNYNNRSMLSIISKHIESLSKNILNVFACYTFEDKKKDIVFLIIHDDEIESDVQEKLKKYKVFCRKKNYVDREKKEVFFRKVFIEEALTKEEDKKVRECIAEKADELFKEHSNITMILPNNVKSTGYGKKHTMLSKTCIVLFVPVKGLIPVSEDKFPDKIGDYATDVMEGTLSFFVNTATDRHDNIKLGCQIKSSIGKKGTVGPIIRLKDNNFAFITAAHIVCKSSSNDDISRSIGKPIYQPDDNDDTNCIGYVNERPVVNCEMEIAVIRLIDRWPEETGIFPECSSYVKENGFCSSNTFYSGDYCSTEEGVEVGTKVYMFGSQSGATKGIVRWLSLETRTNFSLRLKKQLGIADMSHNAAFSQYGDSGSAVFVKKSDGGFKILGVLVSGGQGVYIVTPIWNICNATGYEPAQFKPNENLQTSNKNDIRCLREEITGLNLRFESMVNTKPFPTNIQNDDVEMQEPGD